MLTFSAFLQERVLSIGLNPKHEQHREKYRQQMHDMIQKAYSHPDIGGYGGHKSGSKEESDAIHDDITHSVIKAVRRDGKLSAVNLYKKKHGLKSIASATDETKQGKADWKKTKLEDHEKKRAWGETSGSVEHLQTKMGVPKIPSSRAKELLGKDVKPVEGDPHKYVRKIGSHDHEKVMMGHPKTS